MDTPLFRIADAPTDAHLTPAQTDALTLEKNVMVKACAGSGKTTVLVNRFIKLLWDYPDLKFANILAITFTKKAAGEMRLRLQEKLSPKEEDSEEVTAFKTRVRHGLHQLDITTIHGFCSSVLSRFPLEIGIDPNAAVLAADQQELLLTGVIWSTLKQLADSENEDLKLLLKEWHLDAVFRMVDRLMKVGIVTGDEALPMSAALLRVSSDIKRAYQSEKRRQQVLDYDDLLALVDASLQEDDNLRHRLQAQYQFIMVDEFQDTDALQWSIIQQLCDDRDAFSAQKLFIVGDPYQSIYGFRGAKPELFNRLWESVNSGHTVAVTTNDNFRSAPGVISFVNKVCSGLFSDRALGQFDPIIARSTLGDMPYPVVFEDTANSVSWSAGWVKEALSTGKWSAGDIGILCRNKRPMVGYKKALSELGVDAHIYAGTGLFEQQEVLDLYNVCRAVDSPGDYGAWVAVLRGPFFGISDGAILMLDMLAPKAGLMEKLRRFNATVGASWVAGGLPESDVAALLQAKEWVPQWLKQYPIRPLHRLLPQLLNEYGGWERYAHWGEQAVANMEKFIRKLRDWHYDMSGSWQHPVRLLHLHMANANLESLEQLQADSRNMVSVMSIHAAKGLEFPVVVLPELERKFNFGYSDVVMTHDTHGLGLAYNDNGPHKTKRDTVLAATKESVRAEEKRLLYVALTRAQSQLVLAGKLEKVSDDSLLGLLNPYLSL